MPTSKRDLIKRRHTAIHNALERSMGWTLDLKNQFQGAHPDYAKGYEQILLMLHQAQTSIDKMKRFI